MLNDREAPVFEKFRADLEACHVSLPLSTSDNPCGVVFDADGRDVFTVDVNRERPDLEAYKIANWLVLAVNICGGYRKSSRPITRETAT